MVFAVVPPAIQGLGVSGGFQMQLLLKGGSGDYAKLQEVAQELIRNGNSQSGLTGLSTSFRATVPQLFADVEPGQGGDARTSPSATSSRRSSPSSARPSSTNSTNSAAPSRSTFRPIAEFRLEPGDLTDLYVRNRTGQMVPLGTLTEIDYTTGPALLSLYNLYPTATDQRQRGPRLQLRAGAGLMEQMADAPCRRTWAYAWTGMSYQEKQVGGQATVIFGLSLLVVFLLLAAQYESWANPLAVILIVPLALLGVVIAVAAARFRQQHLHPDRRRSADRAGEQERDPHR